MSTSRSYASGLLYSLVLHAIVLSLFVMSFDDDEAEPLSDQPVTEVVQASVLDASDIDAEVKKLKQREETKRLQEQERQQRLHEAIEQTFHHRGTTFELIDFSEENLKPLDKLWGAHLKNLGNVAEALKLPENIKDAIIEIHEILTKPTLEYSVTSQRDFQ